MSRMVKVCADLDGSIEQTKANIAVLRSSVVLDLCTSRGTCTPYGYKTFPITFASKYGYG